MTNHNLPPDLNQQNVVAESVGKIASASELAEQEPLGVESSFIWDYLTEAQREESREIVKALCAMPLVQEGRSGLVNRPANADDFRVLKTGSGKNLRHSVVYSGPKIDVVGKEGGIWHDGRSWDGVLLADSAKFTLETGSHQVDLRTTQTRDRLEPLVRELLPMEKEYILLTGEPVELESRYVPMIMFLPGGVASRTFEAVNRKNNDCLIGFRPAVDLVG